MKRYLVSAQVQIKAYLDRLIDALIGPFRSMHILVSGRRKVGLGSEDASLMGELHSSMLTISDLMGLTSLRN